MSGAVQSKANKELYEKGVTLLPRPEPEWIVRHVLHAIDVGGEDCVGIGGDLDGTDSIPDGIRGVADYPMIADLLAEAGLRESQIEKFCYQNMKRAYCTVLP